MKSVTGAEYFTNEIKGSETGFCTDLGAKPGFVPYVSFSLSACTTAATFSLLSHVLLL